MTLHRSRNCSSLRPLSGRRVDGRSPNTEPMAASSSSQKKLYAAPASNRSFWMEKRNWMFSMDKTFLTTTMYIR